MMEQSPEERFVSSYIRKSRRERLLYELTTPKKRYRGLSRFCHRSGDLIDPAKIRLQGDDLDRQPAFERFVRTHGGLCDILSPDGALDGLRLPLSDAVEAAIACFDAVLILGDGYAVVFGEVEMRGREKVLLTERGNNDE